MHSPPTDEVVERAQTSPIGVVLILGITLSAAVAIVVIGGAALENSQEDSRIGQAEQALTQFDSKAAQVSLGDSESQTVTLGTSGGSYTVDENAGKIRIYHENWNETASVDDEYIFGNETHAVPLGSVVYRSGDTTIAYQGGGVWRKDGDGGITMISPPEFHYRKATLTFPIVRVEGSGSVQGNTRAQVTRVETARDIYPDQKGVSTALDKQYESEADRKYINPVQEGNMTVEIESEYCEAWRTYFLERTAGKVTDCGDNDTVTAQIVALGTQGVFDITEGGELRIRGMEDGHALKSFELEFRDDQDDSSVFNNFGWDLTGTNNEGDTFGIYLRRGGGMNDLCDDPDATAPVDTTIYYDRASSDNHNAFRIPTSDTENAFHITCEDGQQVLTVDMLNSSRNATYAEIDKKPDHWKPSGKLNETEEFSGHADVDQEPISFVKDNGDEAPLDLVVQHYMAEFGNGDLETNEKNEAHLAEGSTGDMEYEGGGQVVTFLHVTENRIEVELN